MSYTCERQQVGIRAEQSSECVIANKVYLLVSAAGAVKTEYSRKNGLYFFGVSHNRLLYALL